MSGQDWQVYFFLKLSIETFYVWMKAVGSPSKRGKASTMWQQRVIKGLANACDVCTI